MPLAIVIMSGTTFQCSMPNHLPVRPQPVMTSSAMSSTPWRSQMSRSIGQYSGAGTATPAEKETGSAITAATVFGPSSRMMSSTAWAQRMLNSDGESDSSSRR